MFGFKYHLMSPQYVHEMHSSFFNKMYAAWKSSFTEVLENGGGLLDPDDFFRSHIFSAITHQDEVVGLSTMTLFDLNLQSSLDHHYIRALQPSTTDKLLNQQYSRLISIEYLNVLPAWRKTKSQILWAEVLIGLGLKLMDESPADIIMGTPRTDVKVLDVCKNLEAIEVQEPILKMNYPCAVVIFPKKAERTFVNPLTQIYVNELYKTKIFTGPVPFQLQTDLKKAS